MKTESIIVEVNKRVARGYGQDLANSITVIALEQLKAGELAITSIDTFLRWSLTCAGWAKKRAYWAETRHRMEPLPLQVPALSPSIEDQVDARMKLEYLVKRGYGSKLKRLSRYNDMTLHFHKGEKLPFTEVSRERIRQDRKRLKAELERFENFQKEVKNEGSVS